MVISIQQHRSTIGIWNAGNTKQSPQILASHPVMGNNKEGLSHTHTRCESLMETTCPDSLLGLHHTHNDDKDPWTHYLHIYCTDISPKHSPANKHLNGCDPRLDATKWPHQPSVPTEPASNCRCGTTPWTLTGPRKDPRGIDKYLCKAVCKCTMQRSP